jgi:hypothetical protein
MRRARKIVQHFPYHVVVPVAADKLVTDVIATMYQFCRVLELPCRMQTREAWDHVIWRFANPMHARTFQREFGGELITTTTEE